MNGGGTSGATGTSSSTGLPTTSSTQTAIRFSPGCKPGEIAAALPAHAPEDPEPFDAIMADFERVLVPGLTHWNHPRFFAYFAISASPPGHPGGFPVGRAQPAGDAVADLAGGHRARGRRARLAAAAHRACRTPSKASSTTRRRSPRCTRWRRHGRRPCPASAPEGLAGRSDVRASPSTAPSRRTRRSTRRSSRSDSASSRCARSPSTTNSGCGPIGSTPRSSRTAPPASCPIAVVATVGTTSTTSIDPVPAIADICERERIWLHVDAAYGGAAAMLPSHAHVLAGADRADSLVVNPHKWLFTPFDLSAFYCRRMDVVRAAFSLTPDYLRTPEARSAEPDGHGRPARPPLPRAEAVDGAAVVRGARHSRTSGPPHAAWRGSSPAGSTRTPTSSAWRPCRFSVVCFRWNPAGRRAAGRRSSTRPTSGWSIGQRTGEVFLSHTRLRGRVAIRMAIGHHAHAGSGRPPRLGTPDGPRQQEPLVTVYAVGCSRLRLQGARRLRLQRAGAQRTARASTLQRQFKALYNRPRQSTLLRQQKHPATEGLNLQPPQFLPRLPIVVGLRARRCRAAGKMRRRATQQTQQTAAGAGSGRRAAGRAARARRRSRIHAGGSSGCRSRVAENAASALHARQKISAVCFARSLPLCQTTAGCAPRLLRGLPPPAVRPPRVRPPTAAAADRPPGRPRRRDARGTVASRLRQRARRSRARRRGFGRSAGSRPAESDTSCTG